MEPSRPKVRPAVLLSLVGALAIACRVQISWLETTTSNRGIERRTVAQWCFLVGTFVLAAAISLVAAVATKRRVNRILAALLAALVGGLLTAWYNALPGVALGGAIGVLVAFATVRRILLAALTVIAALLAGVVGGTAVLSLTGNPGYGWYGPPAWSMFAFMSAVASLLVWHAWRGRVQRRWLRVAGHAVLLLAVVAGQWLSLWVDTLRRVWWFGIDYQLCYLPCDESWLYRGFIGVESFEGRRRVNDRELATIAGWQELERLSLQGAAVTDAGLVHIGQLTRLQELALVDSPIAGDGLTNLAGLRRLVLLDLKGTQVTDRTLPKLPTLPALMALFLDRTQITDEGMQHLRGLSQITVLGLSGTRVRGEGLRHFDAMHPFLYLNLADTAVTDHDLALLMAGPDFLPDLGGPLPIPIQNLDLSGTRITDQGIQHLHGVYVLKIARTEITDEGLRQLVDNLQYVFQLDLSDTRVTDEGLAHLKTLPNLTDLQLAGTRVTTAGLSQLEGLPKLRELDVRQTAVRGDDLSPLRNKLPNLRISIDGQRK